MSEGKHQMEKAPKEKKSKGIMKVATIVILMAIIISGGVYFIKNMPLDLKEKLSGGQAVKENKKEDKGEKIEKTEKLIDTKNPTIWYYDSDNIRSQIKDGTLFRKHIKIETSGGNITTFTRNGEDFKEEYSSEEKLSEGEYVIKVESEAGSSCEIKFIIDTIPPKVTGVSGLKTYKEVPTIKLEDISDIKEATLIKNDKDKIDIKEKSKKQDDGSAIYEVKENGQYILKVQDIHGIKIERAFKVEIK